MKLIATKIDRKHEAMKRENRKPNVYPPPDDGQEWILLDEAAKLFGIKPRSMIDKARKRGFTRTCRHGVKVWLLKKEVMDWLDFVKKRERWYKRRRPEYWQPVVGNWEGMTDAELKRFLWTTKQAADFIGVSPATICKWAKSGKLVVCLNRRMGKGGKYWFAPTALQDFKESEQRLEDRKIREKGKASMKQGISYAQVYKQRYKPRTYKKAIPEGWITVRQAADLLNISQAAVRKLCRHPEIITEHFTGKWDAKHRPWFILKSSLEAYIESEYYQRKHREGMAAHQLVIDRLHAASDGIPHIPKKPSSQDHEEFKPAYSYAELMANREQATPLVSNPELW